MQLRRGIRWRTWGAVALAVVAAVAGAAWWIARAQADDRRARVRAVLPALEEANAAYAGCALGDDLLADWAAGIDVVARARDCAIAYGAALAGAQHRVHHRDWERLATVRAELGFDATVEHVCADVLARRAALDELRRWAGLRPAPGRACHVAIPPLDGAGVGRLEGDGDHWALVRDDLLVVGRDGRDGSMLVAHAGDAAPQVSSIEGPARLRWGLAQPWAIADGVVYTSDGGPWAPGVRLPRLGRIAAMRESPGFRTVVGWRGDELVVLTLDAAAARVLSTVSLGRFDGAPRVHVSAGGDVTAVSAEDGNVVVHLRAGTARPTRATLSVGAGRLAICGEDDHVIVRAGRAVHHSADDGATFTPLGELPDDAFRHAVCGPGWYAALATDGRDYVVCRGRCTTSPVTTRRFDRFALARHGAGVRALASDATHAVVFADDQLTGTLRFHGAWTLAQRPTFLRVDGTWFHASGDPGAY